MNENKIIKLDTNSKVQFALFDFFAPLSVLTLFVFVGWVEVSQVLIIVAILLLIICLIVLCIQLKRYNRFVMINQESIMVCSGNAESPKLIEKINISDVEQINKSLNISIKTKSGKNANLLYIMPSIFGLLFYIGPLLIFIAMKCIKVKADLLNQICTILPQLKTESMITETGKDLNSANPMMWIILTLIIFLGLVFFIGGFSILNELIFDMTH